MGFAWDLGETRHTFEATGRTVLLRAAPNSYAIFERPEVAPYLDQFTAGKIKDPEVGFLIMREICRAQMVRPRIAEEGEPLPEDQDPEDPEVVPYATLLPGEVNELVGIWKESAARADRFRDERDGDGAGEGGTSVEPAPEPAPRARARKPRGGAA